ncbi:MAG: hypothetical protein JWM11_1017 [Planctomycetaceae bacterium]|nr:hypothetical protein [Planctomycetaceae bacterium]
MEGSRSLAVLALLSCLVTIAGCAQTPQFETDYAYEVFKKALDDKEQIIDREKSNEPAGGTQGGQRCAGNRNAEDRR